MGPSKSQTISIFLYNIFFSIGISVAIADVKSLRLFKNVFNMMFENNTVFFSSDNDPQNILEPSVSYLFYTMRHVVINRVPNRMGTMVYLAPSPIMLRYKGYRRGEKRLDYISNFFYLTISKVIH